MNDLPRHIDADSTDNQVNPSGTYPQANNLLATQKLLRATLDASRDMIQVFEAVRNEQGEIIDFIWLLNNHASEKIYGDVVGKSLLQRQPGVVEEGIFDAFKRVVETGLPQQYEKHYVHEPFDGWFYQSVVKLDDGVATTTRDITQAKQAEQETLQLKDEVARQVTDKYLTLFNSIYQGFALCQLIRDEDGQGIDHRILELNPAFEQQTGISRQIQLGRRAREVFPTLDPWWSETYSALMDSREPMAFEQYFKEVERWYEIGAYPMQGDGDQFAVLYNDITERKKAEQQQAFLLMLSDMLRTERTVDAIANRAIQLLIEQLGLDRSYIVTYYVDEDRADLDYQIGNDSVAPLPDHFVLSNYPEAFKTTFEKTVVIEDDWVRQGLSEEEKRNSRKLDMRAMVAATLRKENKPLWSMVAISACPRRWTKGEIKLVEEVAERTWAAVERAKAEEASRTSQKRFESIANLVPDLLWESEPNGSTNWYNQRWLAYTGQRFEEAIGWGWTDTIHPDDRTASARRYDEAVATGQALRQEHRIRRHDGVYRWFVVSVSPIKDDRGQVVKVYGAATDIHESKQAEEALSEREQQLRLITDAMPALISYMDADFRYRFVNQYYQHWFGLTPEAIIGKRIEEIIGDAAFELLRPYGEAALAGQRQSFEEELVFRHGGTRYVQSEFIPDRRPDGTVAGYYALVTDITARKRAEEGSRRSEAHLATIFQMAQVGISELDTEGRFLRVNDKLCQLLGRSHAELLGLSLTEVTAPADVATSLAKFHQLLQTGQPVSVDKCYQRPDGTLVWANSSLSLLTSEAGDSVLAITVDLTQRRQAEAARIRSEERLQKALSIRTVGVIYFDLDGAIHDANEAFMRMSGYTKGDFVQGKVRWDALTTPDFMTATHNARQEYRTNGENTPYEKESIRPDGSRWWGLFAGKQLSEQEYVEFVLDISSSKQAQQALEQADRRKDEFLAMLAHELRNPMATIRSGLQILSLSSGEDEMATSTVSMMSRQTDHLVHMVDDLLDVSRISRGKIELKKVRVNLVDLVQQAVDGIQAQFDQQGKRLQVSLPGTPINLNGDATRLTQVVTNLLTNGLRYTGEQGQVWLSLTAQHQEAILQVRDDGIGLLADQLSAIFELFVQVDNSLARSKGGLGLGLTLVKRLVDMHGGRVDAQSEGIGRGSTFTIHLPTLATLTESSPETTPQVTETATVQRLLVIDDNTDAALMMAMLLKLKGYETHTRNSGSAGIEAAEHLQPAAILLDIGMPGLDGYETCRLLREQPWGQAMVLIALTGYGQEEDRQRTKEAGFDGHLVKPVDLQTLTKLLTDLLDKKRK